MGDELSVDLAGLRAAAAGQSEIADRAMLVAAELKAAIERAGAAWGTDKPGKTFEEFYLPGSEQAVEALDQMVTVLNALGSGLDEAAGAFEAGDIESRGHIARSAPFFQEPPTAEIEPAVAPYRFAPADGPVERTGAVDPVQREVRESPTPAVEFPGDDRATAANRDRGQDRNRDGDQQPGSRSQHPEAAAPEIPGAGPAGQAPVTAPEPVHQRAGAGHPTESRTPARPGNTAPVVPAAGRAGPGGTTPWSGRLPKDAGGPPGRAVSAPRSPHRPSDPLPPRPMTPRPTAPQKPAAPKKPGRPVVAHTGHRPAPEAVPGKPERARPAPDPGRPTAPEVLRIVREMAARHGLTLVGFETAGIGEHTARALAAALDQVLTTHHMLDLRVVEIVDSLDGRTAGTRWDRVGGDGGPVTEAARLVLNRASIAEPPVQSFEKTADRGPGSIHAAVIRELGRTLDMMGGHAAQRAVQRTLIRHFLESVDPHASRRSLGRVVADYRRWRDTLPGAGSEEFVPATVLVEAFAAVVTGPARSGSATGTLHRLLVETAAGGR